MKLVVPTVVMSIGLLMHSISFTGSFEEIKQKYNPTPERCRAAVNPDVEASDDIDHRIACMLAGYKNIFWGGMGDLDAIDPQLKPFLAQLNVVDFLTGISQNPKNIIICVPRAEKSAYLFILYWMQRVLISSSLTEIYEMYVQHTKVPMNNNMRQIINQKIGEVEKIVVDQVPNRVNEYLIGTLLDYLEKDIVFYYQRNAFIKTLKIRFQEQMLMNKPLKEWPENTYKKFQTFIEQDTWRETYEIDKELARLWLSYFGNKSIEQLKEWHKILTPAIEFLLKNK